MNDKPANHGTIAAPIMKILTTQFLASPRTISSSILGRADDDQATTFPKEDAPRAARTEKS